jgi:hypothetical protein
MNVIERAYQLAQGGSCKSVRDIATSLKLEGYSSVDAHLQGPSIRKSLTKLLAESAAARAEAVELA